MKEIDPSLEAYVEAEIIPATRISTARTPRTTSARSSTGASRWPAATTWTPDMVYVIAAYHDTGLAFGRERHHIDAGRILAEDAELRRRFDSERIATMREAVEDHRASSGHAPRSIYGRIVAEADRCIDTQTILRRTVQYGLAHCPALTREEHFARCREHLQRKYAEGGYLRLWLPESDNARRLAELREAIRDGEQLRRLFDAIFDAETSGPAGGTPDRTEAGGGGGTVASATDGPDTKKIRRRIASRHRRPPSFAGKPDRPDIPESRGRRAGPETITPPVGEILHVLHALVMVALGRPVVHPPAELVERGEALTTGPLVDETADPRNRLVAVTVDRRADLHRRSAAQQRLHGSLAVVHARQKRPRRAAAAHGSTTPCCAALRSSDGSLNGSPATKHIFSTSISGSKKRL